MFLYAYNHLTNLFDVSHFPFVCGVLGLQSFNSTFKSLKNCVKEVEEIAYSDLGTEAIRKLYIEDFPVFVGIDVKGDDIYD